MARFTLYWSPMSCPARFVYMVCMYHKVDVEVKTIDLYKGEQFTPEFKLISPYSTVPTLVDHENKTSLFESAAIVLALADEFNWSTYNLGNNRSERQRVMNHLISNLGHTVSNIFAYIFSPIIMGVLGRAEMASPQSIEALYKSDKVQNELSHLEHFLVSNNGTLIGTPTIADIQCVSFLALFINKPWGIGITDYSGFPTLRKWVLDTFLEVATPEVLGPVTEAFSSPDSPFAPYRFVTE